MIKTPEYIKEPTDLQCGQAVIAMLTGKSVGEIVKICGTERETTLKQMRETLSELGLIIGERKEVQDKSKLPDIAVLSLETPRCWHWSLYFRGKFYDPEHGVLDDFPKSHRKYYFEISEE